jgi:hypothetical protein
MRGTLFRLYPQSTEAFSEPELIAVSLPAGTIGPGPSDGRMAVVDALDKQPYDPPGHRPPFRGPVRPPAMPDADGHFHTIPVGTPQFLQAHLYGSVRLTLDVWEKYLGHPVRWLDTADNPHLELVPLVNWSNAHSGFGFLETGVKVNDEGEPQLFCLNLDVVAHETGHTVLFAELGVPSRARLTPQFLAFHESIADVSALLTAMHFEVVIMRVLTETSGNLYVLNDFNRIGELSSTQQIRVADNTMTLADVADLELSPTGEWIDPTGQGRNAHALAQPLTGAIFDFLVDLFQEALVRRGMIDPDLDARGWQREEVEAAMDQLAEGYGERFALFADDFRDCLVEARDLVGSCIGLMLERVDIDDLTFGHVAGVLLEAVTERVSDHAATQLAAYFDWRGIEPVWTAGAVARRMLARGPRYSALRPFAHQAADVRRLGHLACCRPWRRADRGQAMGINQIIHADHRRPG